MSYTDRLIKNSRTQRAERVRLGTISDPRKNTWVAPDSWMTAINDYNTTKMSEETRGNIAGRGDWQQNVLGAGMAIGKGAYGMGKELLTGVARSGVAMYDLVDKAYDPFRAQTWAMYNHLKNKTSLEQTAKDAQNKTIENLAEKTYYEKLFGKDLSNFKDARGFVVDAALAPTYLYGGGKGIQNLMNSQSSTMAKVIGNTMLGAGSGAVVGAANTFAGDDYNKPGAYLSGATQGAVGGAVFGAATTAVGSAIGTVLKNHKLTVKLGGLGLNKAQIGKLTNQDAARILKSKNQKAMATRILNQKAKQEVNGAAVLAQADGPATITNQSIEDARARISEAIAVYRKDSLPIYKGQTKTGRSLQFEKAQRAEEKWLQKHPEDYIGAQKAFQKASAGKFDRSLKLEPISVGENDMNALLKDADSRLTTGEKLNFNDTLPRFLSGEAISNSELKTLSKGLGINVKDIIDKQTTGGMIKNGVRDTFGNFKAAMATGDISVIGRQNFASFAQMLFTNPKKLAQINAKGATYIASKDALIQATDEHISNPLFKFFIDHKLEFTRTGGNAAEDIYQNKNFISKIPVLGKMNDAAERHFTGVSNDTRMFLAEKYYNQLVKAGFDPKKNGAEFTLAMEMVNAATGKGTLPKVLSKIEQPIKDFTWSAGLISSRLHYLNPRNYLDPKIPWVVKKANISQAASMIAVATGFLVAAEAAGAKVEKDPRSTNFLKAKFGDTWVDFTGGFQPYLKFAAQEATGQVKTNAGNVVKMDSTYGGPTRFGTATSFARGKLSPLPAFAIDASTGRNSIGDPWSLKKQLPEYITPMAWRDIYDEASQENPDLARLLGISTAAMVGLGINKEQTAEEKGKIKSDKEYLKNATPAQEYQFRVTGKQF